MSGHWEYLGSGLDQYIYDYIRETAPVAVAQGSQQFVALSAGLEHACALNATGHAWCCE